MTTLAARRFRALARGKTSGAGGFEHRLSMPPELVYAVVTIAHMKGNPAMAAEIIDLAAVRNARRQPAKFEPEPAKFEPLPEPTPEQMAAYAQDFLDMFVPLASRPPLKRSRRRPT
jgi:hypothetical protein